MKTELEFKIGVHTNSSQKVVGTYPSGMTKEDVEKVVSRYGSGPSPGYFKSFGDGEFVYIASTD